MSSTNKNLYPILAYINNKIELRWSPDQIINRNDNNKPDKFSSLSTIYRWIHLGYIPKTNIEHLRRKGKFKRPAETRGKFNLGKTIKKGLRKYTKEIHLDIGKLTQLFQGN